MTVRVYCPIRVAVVTQVGNPMPQPMAAVARIYCQKQKPACSIKPGRDFELVIISGTSLRPHDVDSRFIANLANDFEAFPILDMAETRIESFGG